MSADFLAQQEAAWDSLTPAEQATHRGNTDPWAGPIDPAAWQRDVAKDQAAARRERPSLCGCWRRDCGECGPRMSLGQRPVNGQRRRYTMQGGA